MTTVLITGPTKNLGRYATLAMAGRADKPDLILVGRAGKGLTDVADEARGLGATVREIGCDLANLADVRAAAVRARELLDNRVVRPLTAIVANAGLMSQDTRNASADGYEMTFAVNHLAHAQLIKDLEGHLATSARIVLLGSNTYSQNFWRKLLNVPEAKWADPLEIAKPAGSDTSPGMAATGVAYSNAKLAILYYAHELQRRVRSDVNVTVFEPGWMPGTALGRNAPQAFQRMAHGLGRLPGVSKPEKSGPALASIALDSKWANLRDGAFVLKDKVIPVRPVAQDRSREARLWEATDELLQTARTEA